MKTAPLHVIDPTTILRITRCENGAPVATDLRVAGSLAEAPAMAPYGPTVSMRVGEIVSMHGKIVTLRWSPRDGYHW